MAARRLEVVEAADDGIELFFNFRLASSLFRQQMDGMCFQNFNLVGKAFALVIVAPQSPLQLLIDSTSRDFPMLRDGKYAAWFRTPRGDGTGLVDLIGGRISGCDSFFTYGGSYQIDQQRFSAVLTVKRHTDGSPSVFGLDEVEVNLSGECGGAVATCSGSAREAPEVRFECTLIYSREDAPTADTKCAVVQLNADKLPKGLDSRSRPRPPGAPSRPPTS